MTRTPNFLEGLSIEELEAEQQYWYGWDYRFGGKDNNRLRDIAHTLSILYAQQ